MCSYLISILHMYITVYPFMPIQGHHHWLSLTFLHYYFQFSKESSDYNMLLLCPFLMKTSLNSTPSYQLNSFSVCYCTAKLLERSIYKVCTSSAFIKNNIKKSQFCFHPSTHSEMTITRSSITYMFPNG